MSYIRLFAVGVAGVAVAASFNSMALAGVKDVWSGLGAALILFLAHTLNLILSALGVLVHGVRLNTLEFSTTSVCSGRALRTSRLPGRPGAAETKA